MLAPMQGLTNRALRAEFIDWVQPDVVFTEFVRVNAAAAKKRLAARDLEDMAPTEGGVPLVVPLVVQLIGHGREALVAAAETAQAAGAAHLNLNLGCPYGRMTSGLTGGGMLQRPELLTELIPALRQAISGTFSIKLRAGYADHDQVFSLLSLFESAGVDFLVLHPRTVQQEYAGRADHGVTAAVVQQTSLPVIANGDIRTAAEGERVLRETGAAGLMLGRGAIADPLLFQRLRGLTTPAPTIEERTLSLQRYLRRMLERYTELFCGDAQVLGKIKAIVSHMDDPELARPLKQLLRSHSIAAFTAVLDRLG
jgi:tRNA-dihydrouridine synthase B